MQRSDAELERTTLARVTWRLIPFMSLLYVICMLDRSNVTYAVLTMQPDLHLSDAAYGFGVGVFFVGYFLFEVPSNLMLEKLGARVWIARIMVTWGIGAAAMMFTRDALSFYVLRFLLGLAEAGFFPGMMLYLDYWFPTTARARAASRFVVANVLAGIIGGPLCAALIRMNGLLGLRGWQWLFLLEGIPACLLGIVVFFYMTDRPEDAHWLAPEQRSWLVGRLAAERKHRQQFHGISFAQAFAYPRVLHLAAIMFLNAVAGSGLGAFTALILKQRGHFVLLHFFGWWTPDQQVLLITAVPGIIGAIALLYAAGHSDRRRERRSYVSFGYLIAAFSILLIGRTQSVWVTLAGLILLAIGNSGANAPFWALTTGFLTGAAAAGGIAFINSVGNLGSFFGPVAMGDMKRALGSYDTGLVVLAAIMGLSSLLAFLLPHDPAEKSAPREAAGGVPPSPFGRPHDAAEDPSPPEVPPDDARSA